MIDLAQYVGGVLVLAGGLFSVLGALGLLRFPDLYTRLHAAALAGPPGLGLVFVAIAFTSLDLAISSRVLIGIGFLAITTPVAAHLLARAAKRSGVAFTDHTSDHTTGPKAK
ncbi:MAG: monovalent cation/H(+) antiporter subunit G [Devosia sp.]